MSRNITPVITGAAQLTQPKATPSPLDPLRLIAETCQATFINTGIDGLGKYIDALYMCTISSWGYPDPPGQLCDMLRIKPTQKVYEPISGNVPQSFVNRAARAIACGEHQAVLIAGGEAAYSQKQYRKERLTPDWPGASPEQLLQSRKLTEAAVKYYLSELEFRYKINTPATIYALIETARRAAAGQSLKAHLERIGRQYERFSKVAAENPYAWNRIPLRAEEIITPASDNRKICYPYTKRMVSCFYVDQFAALLIMSEELAEKLGIIPSRWVYPMGGADLTNIFTFTQRPKLYDSPAIQAASKLALEQAGLGLADIHAFDLYSCFPCMVDIAMNEIGLLQEDPRPLTLTGGLPFFGGPFSTYSLHPIVTAVDRIRDDPLKKFMILANGGYNTSQSVGIYGSCPPGTPWKNNGPSGLQQKIDAGALPAPADRAEGSLTIEAYTFVYNKDNLPELGIVVGCLENNRRALAHIHEKTETLQQLEQQELVGKTFRVRPAPNTGRNHLRI